MKKIKYIILTLGLLLGIFAAAIPATVSASTTSDEACKLDPKSALCVDAKTDKLPAFITTLVNGLLFILAAVSIIVIIFAGIFYTTSMGDTAAITKAKNTLLYAVIGLIVAIFSYAIVNFVVKQFIK
jgi:TRAP-type C4-dicarboxylate transport system permease small subunit